MNTIIANVKLFEIIILHKIKWIPELKKISLLLI
jgi:hypothetical protein